jgi:hypothetical protein
MPDRGIFAYVWANGYPFTKRVGDNQGQYLWEAQAQGGLFHSGTDSLLGSDGDRGGPFWSGVTWTHSGQSSCLLSG